MCFNCRRWLTCCCHARIGFLGIAFSSRFPVPPARNPCPPKVDPVHRRCVYVPGAIDFNCKRWLSSAVTTPELVFWDSRSHRVFLCLPLATPVHRRWTLSTKSGLMLEPSAPYPTHVYVPRTIDFNCKLWLTCSYHARVGFLGIAFSSRFPVPPVHRRWTLSTESGLVLEPSAPYPTRVFVS